MDRTRLAEVTKVDRWLQRGRDAIPQYERDATRAEWLFRKMESFARLHGERLSVIRLADVLAHLESLTRRGHKEWQVMQSLDAICILLRFGCGRENVRFSEVREHWLQHRAASVGNGYANTGTATQCTDVRSSPNSVAHRRGGIV